MSTGMLELSAAGDDAAERVEIPLPARLGEEEEFILNAPPFVSIDADLWLYRDRTTAMLRRYFRFSIEVGRLPSLLGREFFRTRVTS